MLHRYVSGTSTTLCWHCACTNDEWKLQHDGIHRVAGIQILCATWIPAGKVYGRAVLKCVADRVQHIGLDPERVTSLTGPDAQASCRA